MKRGVALAAAAGLVLALGSCASVNTGPENSDNWSEVVVKTNDGRYVRCLIYSGYSRGGPSCDWANATKDGTK